MSDDIANLARAARQLLETDRLLEADFMPVRRNPLPAPKPQPQAAAAAGPELTVQERIAALAQEAQLVAGCNACGLRATCTQTVFGEGDPDAKLVFVGEAPGAEEDATGRPFVGRAGELLTKMIGAMGLRRQDVYICNVLKCRPPNNRPPMPEEAQACRGHLVRQLEIIRPKVLVTLGNPSTQNLLATSVGITRLRGQWQSLPPIGEGLGGIAVMPTFHPAYVLRSYTPDNRQKVWDDLQKVMELLGIKKKA